MSPNWATIADPSVVSVASQKMGVETHSNLVAALQRNAANDTGSDGDGFAKFRLSRSLIDIEPARDVTRENGRPSSNSIFGAAEIHLSAHAKNSEPVDVLSDDSLRLHFHDENASFPWASERDHDAISGNLEFAKVEEDALASGFGSNPSPSDVRFPGGPLTPPAPLAYGNTSDENHDVAGGSLFPPAATLNAAEPAATRPTDMEYEATHAQAVAEEKVPASRTADHADAPVLSGSAPASSNSTFGWQTNTGTFDGDTLTVETYWPKSANPDILFVHHGSSRSIYSSGSQRLADQEGFAVFSPIFPSKSYSSNEYQRGGIVDNQGHVLPDDQWTTRLEDPMVNWATGLVGGNPEVFLFGFSAGGQFLNRVAAYERPQGISRIVVGSPSTWVLPSLAEAAPYGFGGLGTIAEERAALKEYLALPMTIYLGSMDDDPNDPSLSTSVEAMRQGANRLERGMNTFDMGQQTAENNGWAFNWSLVIAQGVGHSGTSMLKAPEIVEALHPTLVPANHAPYGIALAGSSVDETAAGGTVVGQLSATDPDGDKIAFSVAGDARFAVNTSDQLVVATGADLTGTGDRDVTLTVSASDGRGGLAQTDVTVTIRDVNGGSSGSGTGTSATAVLSPSDIPAGDTRPVTMGGAGDDRLRSASAGGYVFGEDGNDLIVDQAGDDYLVGGTGADTFVIDYRISKNAQYDVIADLDFSQGDRLRALGSQSGTFDHSGDPDGSLLVLGGGSNVILVSAEDIVEAAASGGLSYSDSGHGTLLMTFAEAPGRTLEILSISIYDLP
ncbi:MAG: hypothetical protein KDA73_15455 [Rhodobacteraceae bacterium]|nr:hypothetical protein [Paracoccaceae bacterium]